MDKSSDELWKLFQSSGKIGYYMLYKAVEEQENK